jgi:predicted ArsR family transcriptional regulator
VSFRTSVARRNPLACATTAGTLTGSLLADEQRHVSFRTSVARRNPLACATTAAPLTGSLLAVRLLVEMTQTKERPRRPFHTLMRNAK